MSASTKLSTSVKALCYLAESHPAPKTSKQIAEQIDVNASKLRQLLSMMSKEKIVKSTQGISGGFIITKDPKSLHLQEIYCAVETRKAFHLDVSKSSNGRKKKINSFNIYFLDLFADVQVLIEDMMRTITLQTVMDKLKIKSHFKSQKKTKTAIN